MSEDRTQHELLKRELKEKIIGLSIKHSIVTQFTSFVAIEKREEGEVFDEARGPSIEELLSGENVDFLEYMAYDDDVMEEREAEEEPSESEMLSSSEFQDVGFGGWLSDDDDDGELFEADM